MIKNDKPLSALTGNVNLNGSSLVYTFPDADGEYTGTISTQTVDTNAVGVGAALTIASDGHFDEADADADATAGTEVVLACETGTGSKVVLHDGWMYKSNWGFSPTAGAKVYVGLTQGVLTQTAPTASADVVRVVGYFYTASGTAGLLRFKPDSTYIVLA